MRERSWDDFKDVLTKYKMIRPKDAQSTAVMGGVFVLDGNKVRAQGQRLRARLGSTPPCLDNTRAGVTRYSLTCSAMLARNGSAFSCRCTC